MEGFRGRTTQICLENEDIWGGGGGGREKNKNFFGGITSVKQHSNGGSIKFHFAGDKQWPVPNLHVQLSSTYLKINLDRPKNTRISKISNKHIY